MVENIFILLLFIFIRTKYIRLTERGEEFFPSLVEDVVTRVKKFFFFFLLVTFGRDGIQWPPVLIFTTRTNNVNCGTHRKNIEQIKIFTVFFLNALTSQWVVI